MALKVACLTNSKLSKYRKIASAMSAGVKACGDLATVHDIQLPPMTADVAVMYGWKRHDLFSAYKRFVYADLGYWDRSQFFRLSVGAWSPERYVLAGLPSSRFKALGLTIKPWRKQGNEIVIAGSTRKACAEHGVAYRGWEQDIAEQLKDCGRKIVYRPKPSDLEASPIPGAGYDRRPIGEALGSAWAWVTHHSNSAVDALLAGVPVHCQTGAAAVMSVPLFEIADPVLPDGREQFLFDVAWLQWTLDEMKSGQAWKHLKDRGLLC